MHWIGSFFGDYGVGSWRAFSCASWRGGCIVGSPPALKKREPWVAIERKRDEGGLKDCSSQISETESDFFLQLPSYLSFLLFFSGCSWANTMSY